MSAYKVGDEVLVKAKITSVFDKTYTANCSCGNFYISDEDLNECDKDMNAEEAWEIARRICTSDYDGYDNVFSRNDLNEIFGNPDYSKIMNSFTPQEAKAKIEAWEAEKEIKVGDEVALKSDPNNNECKFVVTIKDDEDGIISGFSVFGGDVFSERDIERYQKTGRHIDIDVVLKQIWEDD